MKMTAFNLWAPHGIGPRTIVFDVSPSEANISLRSGSSQWIAAALNDLRVKGTPTKWSVLPARTNFFSDYAEESDWRDRWQKCWIVQVDFAEDVFIPEQQRWMPYPTAAFNQGMPARYEDPAHNSTALVAVAYTKEPGDHQFEIEIAKLLEDHLGKDPKLNYSMCQIHHSWQIRVLLKEIQLPQNVPTLDAVRDYLKSKGGAICWKDVPEDEATPIGSFKSKTLIGEHVVPSDEALKDLLRSEHSGVLGMRSGAELLSDEYVDLVPEQRSVLARRLAGLIHDDDVTVRSGAIRFFQVTPEAPDEGLLAQALAARSPLLVGVGPKPAAQGDLLFGVARALATKAKAGDTTALESLRSEALAPGHAEAVVLPLFMVDRDWLFANAAEIIAGTPNTAKDVLGHMARQSVDLRQVLTALRGKIALEVIEQALNQIDPPEIDELLKALK